jgi:transcriptional regulator with XRE-family HTH domain
VPDSRPAFRVFTAPDAARTVEALHALDSTLLASLGYHLPEALHGSLDATRCYVSDYRRLTYALMEEARAVRPDRIISTPRGLTLCDAAGQPADALLGALENTSAEGPFTAWAVRLSLSEAVALHLANRFRALLGCQVLTEPSEPPRIEDDVAAQRFLRRVRFHLNNPDTMNPLRRVMEAFALSQTDTARLFGVTRQAIAQWLADGVPAERQEKLTALLALLDILQRKLKADRLPGIARRAADAYGGLTMLEMIAADRHDELLAITRDSFAWDQAA